MTLIGGFFVEFKRFFVIKRHAPSLFVADGEHVLRVGQAAIRRALHPTQGLRFVFFDAKSKDEAGGVLKQFSSQGIFGRRSDPLRLANAYGPAIVQAGGKLPMDIQCALGCLTISSKRLVILVPVKFRETGEPVKRYPVILRHTAASLIDLG